ncbi:MAG: glycoside hydrolase family 31 protein [Cytophagales bacterium]|nr:glycoside hydrolase family 31 protein [Cytophagales bacterium]
MPSALSTSLGKVNSIEQSADGIVAATTHGKVRITFFNDSVVRVTASTAPTFDSFSFAVQTVPSTVKLQVADHTDTVVLRSSHLEVILHKNSATLEFRDSAGKLLNEDDHGLGTSWIGEQVTTYKKLQDGERFVGLGEKTGPLDRKGAGYQNWNTDAFAYHSGEDPLYSSIPFYMGIHHGLQYGIFFDNTHKSHFNFGASNNRFSSFSADAGEMNYYFLHGNTVAEIIQGYAELTGCMPLPPRWSIGYQQCRYSYYPDAEVRTLANTFRQKQIPADVIVLDIHYMDKYKIFTWDGKNFPDAPSLLSYLKDHHFEVVLMCDPGINIEEGYEPYDDGCKKDIFVKYPDGERYAGQVWPGWCHFPDFTNTKARSWWKDMLASYTKLGVAGYWNDMNEIATWGHMLPENLEFDYGGEKATSRRARNVYGFQMARSTYEASKDLLGGRRPFNLTRAGYSGVQRYAAVWTGDNVSYDEHMMLGVRMVSSLGLAGVSFAGYDVGGFVGEASPRLFARWISIGAFSPFFRGHTMVNTRDAEPWAFGEEVEQISRNYIQFRYQLLPYLYTAFYESSKTGMPVQRSLAVDYTHDPKVYNPQFQNQYLFGPSFLVAPVESTKDFVKVYFPPGDWYSLYDGTRHPGETEEIVECPIHKLPVFIKAGAVIPMHRPIQHTQEKVEELDLHIYRGIGETRYEFYEDDGTTFDYEKGNVAHRTYHYDGAKNRLILEAQTGPFKSPFRRARLILHGFDSIKKIAVNGTPLDAKGIRNSFFQPLEKFDPIIDADSMGDESVFIATFAFTPDTIEITW